MQNTCVNSTQICSELEKLHTQTKNTVLLTMVPAAPHKCYCRTTFITDFTATTTVLKEEVQKFEFEPD